MGMTQKYELFDNLPEKDILGFYNQGVPQYRRPVEFLHFKKDDVALATNIPKNSVRYDQKMPVELAERIVEWAMAINLVAGHFNDMDKTKLWFQAPNPILGNHTPINMIRLGRFKKLYKFIIAALDENHL